MSNSSSGSTVTVPDELKNKFPELIPLVLNSESMNDEERQYWINILPIMTPDQVQNLRDILDSEKKQLAAIKKKYAGSVDIEAAKKEVLEQEEEIRQRRQERKQAEMTAEEAEEAKTEQLLKKIEQL